MPPPPPFRPWASALAAFGAYFCAYGFRKPFTAAAFAGDPWHGLDAKAALVAAQVLGYTLSKFVGVKVVAELPPGRRAATILGLVAAAEGALALFAVLPPAWGPLALFLNGLPLGMLFGLVLGFLEGRRQSEALAAGLCASFVVADGAAKTVGAYLLAAGVPERLMPAAAAGLLFALPLAGCVAALARIPPPSDADRAARGERAPVDAAGRRRFLRRHAAGVLPLLGVYFLATVLRGARADFAPELWAGLGEPGRPAAFALSESAVGAAVLLLAALTARPRDNRRGLLFGGALALLGPLLAAAALGLLAAGALSPMGFMVLHGVGLYIPYVLIHTTLFERLLAATREPGNVAYLVTLADAVGYLGYAGVLAARGAGDPGGFLPFFLGLSWFVAAASALLTLPALAHFARKGKG